MNHLQDFQHGLTTMSTLLNEQRAVLDESQFARLRATQCKNFCAKAKHLARGLELKSLSLVVATNEQMMAPQKPGKDG